MTIVIKYNKRPKYLYIENLIKKKHEKELGLSAKKSITFAALIIKKETFRTH